MIGFLRGRVAAVMASSAYIEVGGVGYDVAMAATALSKLSKDEDEVLVYTYLSVSDNGVALYGFLSEEEKALFMKLISVGGVGPKVALATLSTFTPAQLVDAVASQDIGRVSKIPGVGKKTAQRIILELKGSLETFAGTLFEETSPNAESNGVKGAVEALLSMGFTSAEAEVALKGAPESEDETALLQYALKRLGSVRER